MSNEKADMNLIYLLKSGKIPDVMRDGKISLIYNKSMTMLDDSLFRLITGNQITLKKLTLVSQNSRELPPNKHLTNLVQQSKEVELQGMNFVNQIAGEIESKCESIRFINSQYYRMKNMLPNLKSFTYYNIEPDIFCLSQLPLTNLIKLNIGTFNMN